MDQQIRDKIKKRTSKLNEKKKEQERIKELKEAIKKEDALLEKCKEYKKSPDFVDDVPMSFDDLDVSAKTIDGEIILNRKLFQQDDWHNQMRYVVHELVHVLQQEAGMVDGKTNKEDYLDDKNEQEAFQTQLKYMDEHTPREIQEYLEHLLDHHHIKGKERREKIQTLTKEI